jgi:DNA-binding NarL/FixJ family response regulator
MDVHMKEMDGLTATKQLKAAHPEAHIVLMSQCHDPEMMEEAKSAGAENFILKDNILEIKKVMGIK